MFPLQKLKRWTKYWNIICDTHLFLILTLSDSVFILQSCFSPLHSGVFFFLLYHQKCPRFFMSSSSEFYVIIWHTHTHYHIIHHILINNLILQIKSWYKIAYLLSIILVLSLSNNFNWTLSIAMWFNLICLLFFFLWIFFVYSNV